MGKQIILCDGFEVVPPPDMNDFIHFGSEKSGGSNCDESTVTTEEDITVSSGGSSPAGVAAEEEWPRPSLFSFYIVKQPPYDDPDIKSKINEADSEIYQCNKRRIDISNTLKSERAEVSCMFTQMESLVPNSEGYKVVYDEKMKEFETLLDTLRNLRCSDNDQLCFSKEELDHLIYMARYVIEQGSIGLEEEDWVLKEKTDEKVLSEDSFAWKESSINSLKSMAMELEAVKRDLDAITWNINHLSEEMGKSQNKIQRLDLEMAYVLERRDKSVERIKMLRIQRDRGNAAYYQSLAVMRKAKELAASRNVRDLEVLARSEVDRFMTHWNKDKAYRDDYVKRSSRSLYERQLSQDGRNKDPVVEPQVVRENQASPKTKTTKEGVAVPSSNRESSSSNSSQDGLVIKVKQKKEAKKKAKEHNKSRAEKSDVTELEFSVPEKPKKEVEVVDEETLKERKREEELEKARLAMERKKKQQEKAAAKAVIRAQKEAEKKLKELEKKAKKKAAVIPPSPSNQSKEAGKEVEKATALTLSGKEKHQERLMFPKQRSFRYKNRGRGTEALPKVILNRRRAEKYWLWGISAAVLAIALFLLFLLLR